MNHHSGALPNEGTALTLATGASTPSLLGLREIALNRPDKREGFDPSDIWRVIAKWWWLILAIVVSCVLAAIVLSLLITPEYRARTTVEVNAEGTQVVKMGELEPMRVPDREFLTTQAALLRSRSLAERVARSLNLANNPAVVNQEAPRASREQAAAGMLMSSVIIEPERDTRLLKITAQSTDPALAAQIANAYAQSFIQSNLERRYEATSYARNFLEQRIATVKAKLEESERQLVAYAQKQGIITLNVDSGNGSTGRSEQSIDAASLVSLNEALSRAKSERIAAEQRFRQAQGNSSTTDVIMNPTVQALSTQRAQLQGEYQEKLNLYKPDFPMMVQMRARIDQLGREIQNQSRSVSGALQSEYAGAVARENALQAKVNSLKAGLLNLRERSIQYTILQREVDTNRSLYDSLLQRFKEVGVAGGVGANLVSIVDRAQIPGAPFKPNLPLNMALALVAGLLLGFGTAFAIEWIDDTVKTPDDLTGKLGLAALGVIPMLPKGAAVRNQLEDPRSQVSEAYQSVRTALQFSTDHGIPRTLLITSTRASEGKSSTALALAQTLASLGASVLLIDGDLRKPTFRGPSGTSDGLSSLLAGADNLKDCIHPTEMEHLFLLPSGQIPPNPAELLSSDRLKRILDEVTGMFDYAIVDAPPVLGLADAPLLASMCEGTLVVIESGSVRRAAVLNSLKRLHMADARIMGGILTKFNATKSGYGYGYGYGYGDDHYAYKQGDDPKKQIELLKSP